jgi:hypothetical protein
MSTRTIRGAGVAVLALGLVSTAFTSAQAVGGSTTPAVTTAPVSKPAALRANALRLLGQSTTKTLAAPTTGITQMTSDCPTGQTLNTVYGHEGFEAGLPFPDPLLTDGFTVATGAGAPEGTQWADSSLLANDPASFHVITTNHHAVPQTGRLYMSFSYRAVFVDGFAMAGANADAFFLAPAPEWTKVALDITSEATTNGDGTIDVGFAHFTDTATAGSFDVDNVSIYSCVVPPPPNSRMRGDWTGQGTVDLMGTRTDGTLWAYEGNGNGTIKAGFRVSGGWGPITWQGSPGDVNGDGRTDMLVRRSDGTLWLYRGQGRGTLAAGTKIGGGWNVMTSISTPGDYDLDGRPDVLARRSDGTLHLYHTQANGGLTYVRKISAGWNSMSSIIGMGDLNADGRGDLVAIRTDGVLFAYLASGTGFAPGKQVGSGWKALNHVTSPGDLTGDGRADLVARTSDGTMYRYSGKAGGSVNPGIRLGGGWNVMRLIL